jgi:hypothetical protein
LAASLSLSPRVWERTMFGPTTAAPAAANEVRKKRRRDEEEEGVDRFIDLKNHEP